MVSNTVEPEIRVDNLPRFIYITGCDGTGKSTQADLLLKQLRAQGIETRHLWLRFPFFFSMPLLAYARWRGYSWYEQTGGVRHGYWDFRQSWVLRQIFPWTFLLDAALASLWKVYLPLLLGATIICERFVLDMLADLSVATGMVDLHFRLPGKLFLCLLPPNTELVVLDLDSSTIRNRRADLRVDKRLHDRLNIYKRLSKDLSLTVFSSKLDITILNNKILYSIAEGKTKKNLYKDIHKGEP